MVTVTMALSCIVSETNLDINRKSRFVHLHSTSPYGVYFAKMITAGKIRMIGIVYMLSNI